MSGKGLSRNKPLKSRTKRKQLLSSTTSITSLFDGPSASTSEPSSPKGILSPTNESNKPVKMKPKSKSSTPLRERWLLTRKTWKYMADAGRRLIPEGMQNRGNNAEDLKKLEEYFQHVCRSEQNFLPWRRKQSYPGALATPALRRSNKRRTIARMFGRSKALSTSAVNTKASTSPSAVSPPKISSADDSEEEVNNAADENHHIYLIIRLLEKYLNLNEPGKTLRSGQSFDSYVDSIDSNELEDYDSPKDDFNTNSTASPTYFAQADIGSDSSYAHDDSNRFKYDFPYDKQKSSSSTSPKSQPQSPPSSTLIRPRNMFTTDTSSTSRHNPPTSSGTGFFRNFGLRSAPGSGSATTSSGSGHTNNASLLYESLRNYTQGSRYPIPGITNLTPDILKDKQVLRRIRDDLKRQQIDRIYRRHGARPGFTASVNVPSTSSDYTSWPYKDLKSSVGLFKSKTTHPLQTNRPGSPQNKQTDSTYIDGTRTDSHVPLISIKCASQDKNIPANESGTQTDPIPIQHIYQLYNKFIEEQQQRQQQEQQANSAALSKSKSTGVVLDGHSSASKDQTKHSRRKSSIDNEDVSQSVSDTIKRYLRMARKKPTSESEANRFKRINYDTNLRNIKPKAEIPKPEDLDLDDKNKKTQTNEDWIDTVINEIKAFMSEKGKEEYNLTHGLSDSPLQSPPSTPTSPTRIFQTTFKHLQRQSQGDQKPLDNKKDSKNNTNMQKSKSSSNIGQALSKKIWKSRSKSQTRPDSPIKSQWVPQGNGLWASANGKRVQLASSHLRDLTDVERKNLQRVALDRINQLNIGMLVKPPAETIDTGQAKPTKRRAPLLLKRKALTTSFFDSNKMKIDSSKNSSNNSGTGPIFGQPLEKSLSRDNTSLKAKQSNTGSSGGSNKSGRSSRSSITSLQDSLLGGGDSGRDDAHLGSCDSLFSKQDLHYITSGNDSSLSSLLFGQGDDVNNIDDEDGLQAPSGIQRSSQPQVPPLVLACIDHLSQHGLNVVGIFRVSTSKRRIRELREQLDSGEMSTFDSDISPHDVASLLKEYLRDLPEPLLCRSLYPAFLSTQRIRNRRLQLEALSHLIQLLPIAHRDTLFVLLKFLAQLARHSDDIVNLSTNTCRSVGNKMDSNNLATVIAPNILHCNTPGNVASDEEAEERLDVINVVRTMIDHYEELFSVPPDVMNDVYTAMMDTYPQQLDYLFERKEYIPCRSNEQSEAYDNENSSDTDASRRVYVREEFTHENSARGIRNAQDDENMRRRERSSRGKNQTQSSHDSIRRQQDKKVASLVINPVSDSNISIASISPPSTPSRKSMIKGHTSTEDYNPSVSYQISPRESNANEVLTASLKLPMQKLATISTVPTPTTGVLNLGMDISNIPYIEDSDSNSPTIYGSKPFSSPNEKTSKKPDEVSQHSPTKTSFPLLKKKSQYQPQYQSKVLTPYKSLAQQKPTKTFHIFGDKPSSNSGVTPVEKSKSSLTLRERFRSGSIDNAAAITTEPKFTASITNIGGDLLRSKTADFERLLKQQSKNSKAATTEEETSKNSEEKSTSDNQVTTKNSSSKQNSNSRGLAKEPNVRLGPIYKRHEVISSATNTKK